MLKKILKLAGIGLVVVAVLMFGWLEYSTVKNNAAPGELALAALESTNDVIVEEGDWLVMKPANASPVTGLIIYPGANCDIRGYAPLMREIAAAGYLVVAISMPYDFAIFDPGAARDVPARFPDIKNWVLAGHSMGGAMAGTFAASNSEMLAGLIMWDSYPAVSLADSGLKITSIHRATLEGEQPDNFKAFVDRYPPESTTWVPVRGGIHMYFGSFIGGGYNEVWEPKISVGEQHRIIIDATINALEAAG
jgi:pimeloyl-ACP methyl ester carboxylesterase